tara:strand:- start:34481 stop:36124 length:1644 start_codon:yes stop_codon:yes gene_type:complete
VSSWTIIFRASGLAAGLAASGLGLTALAQGPQIEVQSLQALDPLEVGLPGAALGLSLWDGTDSGLASRVLMQLPAADSPGYTSPALADLARAVLSSGGYPPAGGRGDQALPVLRADRLLAAGGVFEAYDLLERTPNLNENEPLSRLQAEMAFATGNLRSACHTADALLRGRDQAYWLRARAFCLALDGQGSAAELTAELARNAVEDAGYDALLFAITLEASAAEALPAIDSGLKLAMARQLHGDAALTGIDTTGAPGWLSRFVSGRAIPDAGPANGPAEAFAEALQLSGQARTAALEAVLSQGQDREIAASALSALFDDAVAAHAFVLAARHYGGEVQTLPVTHDTLGDGYRFALAALISGDVSIARRWRDALFNGPPRPPVLPALDETGKPIEPMPGAIEPDVPEWVPPSPRRMVNLDLAMAIASDRLSGDRAAALIAAYQEAQGAAVLGDTLSLERLGADPSPGVRAALLELTPATVGPDLLAMEAAARAGARAETAILAVAALAHAGAQPDAGTLSRSVAALDALGLREAALNLLLERIVARAV